MDPATLGIASLVGSAVSGITGAVGAVSSANANAAASNYAAGVARNNQIIAQQNAAQARQAGTVQAQSRDFKTRAILGAIQAGQGASGIDSEEGSSKQVRDSAQALGRLDTATIVSNAMQTSRGYDAQALNFGEQSTLDRSAASNARTAGVIGAGSSLLGSASSFGDKWLRYQTAGVPGF